MENKQFRPEILAPAGGEEQLRAAVRCGADAVYFGARGFNARRNAENFGAEGIASAVRYCHARGVRVHITLNTLVFDKEKDALIETADEIAEAGVDAVIVQDLAVAKLLRERYPELPLHASTQMAVHNIAGVRLMEELGFRQAVLARELSIEEIRSIRSQTELPLECFVHGALCVSLSGSCYLSSLIGTRSGNRGLCAQPCRMNFALDGGRDHALSLKDLSHIEKIRAFAEAGVATLKIEGRMKRPEYVAAAVTACRKALGGERPDTESLRAVFSRSGFTDGFYRGVRTKNMFGTRTKEDVVRANEVLPKLAALYREEKGNIPVEMRFTAVADTPATLTVTDGTHTAFAAGQVPEPARSVALGAERAEQNLGQTGGTPYTVKSIRTEIGAGLSLPVSEIKRLRREALAMLEEQSVRGPWKGTGKGFDPIAPHAAPQSPALRLRAESLAQLPDTEAFEKIVLPVKEIVKHPECIARFGDKLVGEIPAVVFEEDYAATERLVKSAKELGLGAVYAENCGAVQLARALGLTVHGGALLNILNGTTLAEYERLGLRDATLSFEMPMKEAAKVGGTLPRGLIAYGYLPLMRIRACPVRTEKGCGGCTGRNTLTDERNERFPLICRDKRYRELLNSVPLYVADKRIAPVDFATLYLTTETREEAEHVVRLFTEKAAPDFRRTNGLYFRELP
ncbi:MAG: U32 family peptidase [Clostridia bacterium]|nr:U32 family peptidase [Clostridia bacterium]